MGRRWRRATILVLPMVLVVVVSPLVALFLLTHSQLLGLNEPVPTPVRLKQLPAPQDVLQTQAHLSEAPAQTSVPSSPQRWPRLTGSSCQCPQAVSGTLPPVSSCGPSADARGRGQNVVSFSFFGPEDSVYFRGIEANAELMPAVYPGWTMRVYYADPTGSLTKKLDPLVHRYDQLDLCEVSTLRGFSAELTETAGVLWRFLPLGDPSVERFVCRDLDSVIGQREAEAVQEWVTSRLPVHVMRDHIQHNVTILAGTWGAWNHPPATYRAVLERLVRAAGAQARRRGGGWGQDQALLDRFLYQPAASRGDVLEHDSYFCGTFGRHFRPFPSRRRRSTFPHFVGDRALITSRNREWRTAENWLFYIRKCPLQCRPKLHQDWEWC